MTPLLAAGGQDVEHVTLLAVLLVVPRVLQRFRIPAAVTCFAFGVIASQALGMFQGDETVGLLATFGIVSIFLLAGLEVDFGTLRADARNISQHLLIRTVLVAVCAAAAVGIYGIDARAGLVAALAVLTPSGGFILDSLPALRLFRDEETTIRNKVIATEILALVLLLFAIQSTSWEVLGTSVGLIVAMIVILPLVLRALVAVVVPHAPKSEFAFLVLIAVACAVVTLRLGVYYLVGAFVVGLVARRFRDRVPAMSSERILHAVEAFASVFAPFYFFRAGTQVREADFTVEALVVGGALVVLGCGLRVGTMLEHSRWTSSEGPVAALRKAVPMLPTLVFSLVLAEILRDRFQAPEALVGGIIVYAIVNTMLPSLLMRRLPVPEYGAAKLPPWPDETM